MSAPHSSTGPPTADNTRAGAGRPAPSAGADVAGTEGAWRAIDIYVPAALSASERAVYIDNQVRAVAHDGGEFIHGISVQTSDPQTAGWQRCEVAYLSGPPGMLD